ncbi:MAG: HlyD family efflux transporter periplasmic adaptor subunit [Candidatus Thiodiazotropha sp.]
MRIRNKKSFVVVGPEGKAPKSLGSRITHLLYLAFLALLAIYLIIFTFNYITTFQIAGQVVVERIKVAGLDGGRILSIEVAEGEPVKAGELLLTIDTGATCEPLQDRNLDKLKRQLALDRVQFDALRQREARLQARQRQQLDERRMGRVLELEREDRGGERALQRDLDEVALDRALLEEQIRLQEQQIQVYAREQAPQQDCGRERVVAPVDGRVLAVNRHVHEVVARKETLLVLMPTQPLVQVEAFGKIDEELPVSIGQQVEVILPDGASTLGEVSEFEASAYRFPDREFHVYQPEATSMRVVIRPLDAQVAQAWIGFDRRDVSVKGVK